METENSEKLLKAEKSKLNDLPHICYLQLGDQVCYSKHSEGATREPSLHSGSRKAKTVKKREWERG